MTWYSISVDAAVCSSAWTPGSVYFKWDIGLFFLVRRELGSIFSAPWSRSRGDKPVLCNHGEGGIFPSSGFSLPVCWDIYGFCTCKFLWHFQAIGLFSSNSIDTSCFSTTSPLNWTYICWVPEILLVGSFPSVSDGQPPPPVLDYNLNRLLTQRVSAGRIWFSKLWILICTSDTN